MVLGPSMTYSCAVWPSEDATLEEAQAAKYDLICRKLGLRPGHALARRRLRMGRHGHARGAPLRRAGDRHHAVDEPGRVRAEGRGRRRRRGRRVPRAGLPRRRRPLRRDQLDRHVRARRSGAARPSTSRTCTTCSGRVVACSTTGSVGRPAIAPGSAGAASSTATSSPTASCTRSVPSSRASSSRGSRCGTSRACASTTDSRCGTGFATSKRTGTKLSRRSARPVRASGGSTWPGPRSTSKPAATRSTKCSRSGPTAAAAASPGAQTGSRGLGAPTMRH